MKPCAFATVARIMPPVSIACIAAIGPACLIERAVPLKPGKIPSLTSGKPMRVESSRVAIR